MPVVRQSGTSRALVGRLYGGGRNDATLPPMQRRKLLAVGAATGALLAVAGGTLTLLHPARVEGRFNASTSAVMSAVAQAVLDGFLSPDSATRARQLQAHLSRLQATIAGFPPGMQAEVDQLLSLLAHPAGRIALAGLRSDWDKATPQQMHDALQSLRTSSMALRQQAFHALRDLTNAAYFADPATWAKVGYPGPRAV